MSTTETPAPTTTPKVVVDDNASGGWIGKVIAWSATHPVILIVFAMVLAAMSGLALQQTPLDAIPDLSDTQVIVVTEWDGQSPDLVEDQVTYPLSSALVAMPKVRSVRGQSFFGLSFVYAIFEDGTDLYWARSRVLEALSTARASLPSAVAPRLGPDATSVGWVFQYALVDDSGAHDLAQLRSLQDWTVSYALASVPGVAEVASVGGHVLTYQIDIDPLRLRAHNVTLEQVLEAVRASNGDVGGRVIEIAGHEHMIRGRGYLTSLDDIRTIPIAVADGDASIPITVDQVATVGRGPAMRRGLAELNGEGEVAGGIVVMRTGENALKVIEGVKERIAELEPTLPAGVRIVPVYDRSTLIDRAIETLQTSLFEEMAIVALIILLFLLHVRSALIPLLTLPLAVLCAFIPMAAQGLTANIMSLGGIAVAIGAMVDAAVILIENVHKKLGDWEQSGKEQARVDVMISAMREVGPSIFFSLLVITVSFLPVFSLQATEGRLFRPLAFTKTYAMSFAALLAITLIPALVVLLIRGRVRPEEQHPLNRVLVATYTPVVRFVVRFRWWVVATAAALLLATVPAFLALGSEFMPPLNEGAVLYMPTAPPGMSITEAANAVQYADRQLKKIPEVKSVFGKMGRAETATDPAPLGMAEITIELLPKSEWREGLTYAALVDEMDAAVQLPGMPNIWWMPIQTRGEMLATGIRTPLALQVFGPDLETIEEKATAIERALAAMRETKSAFAERTTGAFYIDFDLDRAAAARFGIRADAVNRAIATAIGGQTVGTFVDGRARYPIQVRYARDFRDHPGAFEDVLVTTASGAQIPLTEVTTIAFKNGPPMIRSEGGQLSAYVFVDAGNVPVADYVDSANQELAKLDLVGVRTTWTGQYKALERANDRLALMIPLTLLLVFFLLYLNTRSVVETSIVLMAVPFSLIGAVWLLWALDYNMSIAVWVGLIALAGLDAETGVVMLLYLKLAWNKATENGPLVGMQALEDVIVEGAARRIRPKLMTVATTTIALVPLLWSTGTGADMMKRVAAPMVGGLSTSFALELLVYPALFAIWRRRSIQDEGSE